MGGAVSGRAKVIEDQNGAAKTPSSIGDALNSPDHHSVHILYVHGIGQLGPGDSALLRNSICARLRLCAVGDWKNAGVEFADKGEFSPSVPPPHSITSESPYGGVRKNGKRRLRLSCIGSCSSGAIARPWCLMKSTGGRSRCPSSAATSWLPMQGFPVQTAIFSHASRRLLSKIPRDWAAFIPG